MVKVMRSFRHFIFFASTTCLSCSTNKCLHPVNKKIIIIGIRLKPVRIFTNPYTVVYTKPAAIKHCDWLRLTGSILRCTYNTSPKPYVSLCGPDNLSAICSFSKELERQLFLSARGLSFYPPDPHTPRIYISKF